MSKSERTEIDKIAEQIREAAGRLYAGIGAINLLAERTVIARELDKLQDLTKPPTEEAVYQKCPRCNDYGFIETMIDGEHGVETLCPVCQ